MPTPNPRVNVTLSPSLDVLVLRMAQLTRTSKSQVLRELLEAAEPALTRTVALMEAASTAHASVTKGIAESLDKAVSAAEKTANRAIQVLDDAHSDLVRQAEVIQQRRPARPVRAAQARTDSLASAGGNPPASNRGVKSSGKGGHRSPVSRKEGVS